MQLKLFVKVFVYTFSTLIVIIMGIIVTHNFVRDGRPFEKPVVAVAKDKSVKPIPAAPVKKPSNSSGTIKSSSSGEKNVEEKQEYKVEIINCTGQEQVGEDLKASLEANGFTVVLKYSSRIKGDTVITERNKKNAGQKVLELLKVGRVYKEYQKEPYFDAIIEIGIDFAP
ncbi:MAG TPA: LytR C-terminal domain-containing protein [Clostridia bacterium]|nr:LytR C-terminal domain-containing protein [Clostridia bacterium]